MKDSYEILLKLEKKNKVLIGETNPHLVDDVNSAHSCKKFKTKRENNGLLFLYRERKKKLSVADNNILPTFL